VYAPGVNRARFLLAFAVAVTAFVAAHFLDFKGSVPNFQRITGGAVLLDMTPSFSEDAIYDRLDTYGALGRENYAFRNITVDVLLPLGLLPFLAMFMNRALSRIGTGRVLRVVLLSMPFAYVLLDLAENGSVLALLARFPERLHGIAAVLPYLTVTKRVASMIALFGPLLILGFGIVRSRFRQLAVAK
jgi:hypothetical protein